MLLCLSLCAASAQTPDVTPAEKIRPLPPLGKLETNSPPSIHGQSVRLQTAIEFYAYYKGRTVLQHPQLKDLTFTLPLNSPSKEDAAAVFEKLFREQNIATIDDGGHFVMLVPFVFTNTVTPRSENMSTTNSMIPTHSVNFWQVPIKLVLTTYADYAGKKILNLDEAPARATITFNQTTSLSKEEVLYAFETEFEWNHIRLVPEGDDLKVEQIKTPK
jgi:hypothetical protein